MKKVIIPLILALLLVSFASAQNLWSEYEDPPWGLGTGDTLAQLKVIDDYALRLSNHRFGTDDYTIYLQFFDGGVWKNISMPSYGGFPTDHVTNWNTVNIGKSCNSNLFYVGFINGTHIKIVSFNPVTESFSDVALVASVTSVVFPVFNSIICLNSGECYVDELKGDIIHRFLPSNMSIVHPAAAGTSTGIFGSTTLYAQTGVFPLNPILYYGRVNGTDVWNITGNATPTGINNYYQIDDNTAVYSTFSGQIYVADNDGWFNKVWDSGEKAVSIDPVTGIIHYSVYNNVPRYYQLWTSPYRQDQSQASFVRNVSVRINRMDFACTKSQGWAMGGNVSYQFLSNGTCGNGQIDPGEDCDGINLNDQDCQSLNLGFIKGDLYCNPDCTFLTSFCDTASFDPWEAPSMGVVPSEPFEQEELPVIVPEEGLPVYEKTLFDFSGLWERLTLVWDFIFTEPLKALDELFNSFKLFWLEWLVVIAVLIAAILLGKKEYDKRGRGRKKK